MKIIDNLLARIKEGVKEKGKKLIIPLTLTTLLTASAQEARADLKKVWREIKNRTSIEASYSCGWPKLNKEFLDNYEVNKWGLTATNLEPAWKPIKPSENLQMLGIGADVKVYENKDKRFSLFLAGGYESGKAKATYNETYTSTWPIYGKLTEVFSREEENKISKPFVGIKVEKELSDRVSVSGSLNADFYKVNGNANLTWKRKTLTNNLVDYTQWRQASYSGKATGFLVGADLEYKLGKNVSVSGGVGYRNASVQTSGKEDIGTYPAWAGGQPVYSHSEDYSPKYVISAPYLKGEIKIRF